MKLEQITRMSGDMEADQKHIWRFLYQHIEKLNILLDEFDSKINSKSSSLSYETVYKIAEDVSKSAAEEAVNNAKSDDIIKTGTGTIEYGEKVKYATIRYGYEFSSKPVVVTSQPFSARPLLLDNEKVTTTEFTVGVEGGFITSGFVEFFWIAIGKKGENNGT